LQQAAKLKHSVVLNDYGSSIYLTGLRIDSFKNMKEETDTTINDLELELKNILFNLEETFNNSKYMNL
jgi:hypothetical protein